MPPWEVEERAPEIWVERWNVWQVERARLQSKASKGESLI